MVTCKGGQVGVNVFTESVTPPRISMQRQDVIASNGFLSFMLSSSNLLLAQRSKAQRWNFQILLLSRQLHNRRDSLDDPRALIVSPRPLSEPNICIPVLWKVPPAPRQSLRWHICPCYEPVVHAINSARYSSYLINYHDNTGKWARWVKLGQISIWTKWTEDRIAPVDRHEVHCGQFGVHWLWA